MYILVAVNQEIKSHGAIIGFGNFPAKLGPETRCNGSCSNNNAGCIEH